ncbi:MAG: DUF1376 domain-containing protein [Roseovarius sp.]|nr:DUF1376 domain-containing protein [Roseovarius sp.]
MQFYVGDHLADTLDLTAEEHGAYMFLLCALWRHKARLPNDMAKLARIARVSPKRWGRIWAAIEEYFFVDGDKIGQKRMDKEFKKAVSISQKRKDAGSLGGQTNALKNKDARQANAQDLLVHSQKPESLKKEEPIGSLKKTSSENRKGTRLSDDWCLPKSWGEWAIANEQLSEAECCRLAEQFKDYWLAIPGHKGVKLDWQATWRNWVRNRNHQSKMPDAATFGAFGRIPEVG